MAPMLSFGNGKQRIAEFAPRGGSGSTAIATTTNHRGKTAPTQLNQGFAVVGHCAARWWLAKILLSNLTAETTILLGLGGVFVSKSTFAENGS